MDNNEPKQTPDDLVRLTELTKRIPLSSALIRQKCDAGELPHWRINSVRFFSVSEVLNALRVDAKSNNSNT